MKLIKAEDLFTQAKELLEGKKVDGSPCERDLEKSEQLLNELLDNNLGNITVLYVLASLFLTKGYHGVAHFILSHVVKASPQFGEAWNNLGLAYKGLNKWDKAAYCAMQASQYIDHPDIPCNVSGLHLNRGKPEIALEWAEKALAKNSNHVKAQWHKAMALLEMGKWEEAWDYHESRLVGGANEDVAERNYHGEQKTPMWDGKSLGRVVIHGEQGMGDEIMFASCIPDAIATGAEIILEPSPRLEGLFKRSFPEAFVHGTNEVDGRGWIEEKGLPDFKCPMGTLPRLYRRSAVAFPGKPYLVPCPEKKAFWQGKLDALNGKPKIGLTWQGGVPSTRIDARSFHPRILAQLFCHDVQWVSLQYDATAQDNVADIQREFGVEIAHWPKAVEAKDPETGQPSDLDELIALTSCLDLVISVPQTAYHVAGALGIPCWVMTPSEPDWRLGVKGNSVPWYESVELFRQEGRDWQPVIAEIDNRLGALLQIARATA